MKTTLVKKFIVGIYFKFPSYLAGQYWFYEKLLCLNYTRIRKTDWSAGYGRELTIYGNIPGNEYMFRVNHRNTKKCV